LESYSFFLASLPREEVTKFSNIHFICVSNLVKIYQVCVQCAIKTIKYLKYIWHLV
jgi:hypothetical protein